MAEATTERASGPRLELPFHQDVYRIGEKVKLSIINTPPDEVLADNQILSNPTGLEITRPDQPADDRTQHFTIKPKEYGSFKVVVESLPDCAPVFINVCPLAKLERRVTGSPAVQLPRDLIICNDGGFIVSDGVQKQIIRINRDGSQELFQIPKNIQHPFSPIGLALKQDVTSEDNNELYVTDLNNACVHVYHGLKHLESFGALSLKKPTGIAIDDDGFIFIADYEEKKIFQFNPNYEPVEGYDRPYSLEGPQLMTTDKPAASGATGTVSLLVADRRGSKISIFTIERGTEANGKILTWVHDISMGICPGQVLPFSVACDENNHIFVGGQLQEENGEKTAGFIWFIDCNSLRFGGHKMEDWRFGDGMRNPGGMRIVSGDDGSSYLYVTDMRGKNAKSCINKFLLKN
ncbi:hypothetical protein HOLleu_19270 [Holothuria leucospilota]|uniref:Uncharacterized protein n=1 Tax=Holothuria leucospilota TaxID=206669 RepID=A0A9Q1BZZ2_HOLLE|nr:hypothetical protein HOLleu_19270 [Holothuria leucospilota]